MTGRRGEGGQLRPPSHIGIVTTDLTAAMLELGARFGLVWEPPRIVERDFVTSTGTAHWTITRTHSTGGPIAIEIIEGGPDTTWQTSALTELHHYAYRSARLGDDVAALQRDGWTLELTLAGTGAGPTGFAYLVRPGEARLELIGDGSVAEFR